MFHDMTVEQLMEKRSETTHAVIDVRSPKEFKEATIPGSINIPVFDDRERAEVGTIYKQVGQEAAKEKGLEIFSKKLPAFIAAFKEIDRPKTVFCWRGGMRSKTAATVLDLMGITATRLSGGIRAYRQWVVEHLKQAAFSPELYVLNGYTGIGKTIMLKKLEEMEYPVIDLEGMAGHRGSIFGQIGMEPVKQKKFDAALVEKMLAYEQEPFVFVEGESKRIGKVEIPERFYQKKAEGLQIFIELPMEERVKNILNEYNPKKNSAPFQEAFQRIKKRIHVPVAKQIEANLENGAFAEAVELLLTYYYDPRYQYANNQYEDNQKITIQAKSAEAALEKVLAFLRKKQHDTA